MSACVGSDRNQRCGSRRDAFRRREGWRTSGCALHLPRQRPAIARLADFATWGRSEEHTSELQPLMRISYAVFCLKKKKDKQTIHNNSKNEYTINLLKVYDN